MKKIFAILLAATIFLAGCGNEEPPVQVTAEKVLSADGALTVTHDGKISLGDEHKVLSPIAGNVVATYFQGGQPVTEGQVLFQIGTQENSAELLQAKAKLSETMTALAKELSELRQAETLLKQNATSAQEVADKKSAVDERQAELDELKQKVQALEEDSAAGIVKAPVSGTIGVDNIQLGAQVSAGDTLATIGKNNPVAVRFEVSQEEKHLLMSSDALKVSLTLTDGTSREGKLNFPDASTAEALFDNSDERLTLGNTARIELGGVKISKALLVPENSIQRRGEENFVFVVSKDNTAAEKKISLGGKLGTYYIVNDGLNAGDSVVVEGLTKLREGTPIKSNA